MILVIESYGYFHFVREKRIRMKTFDYYEAKSVGEAITVLSESGLLTKVVAGGTDLILQIRAGITSPKRLVGITQINTLKSIISNDHNQIEIGAATTLHRVSRSALIQSGYQMIAEAAGIVGSRQIRNLATIGGNNCSAVPSADTAPPLLAAETKVEILDCEGSRLLQIEDFYTGPKKSILSPKELLIKFILPPPPKKFGTVYLRFCPRNAMNLAVVGVAVAIELESDTNYIKKARVALGGVAPTPIRVYETEYLLEGKKVSRKLIEQAALATTSAISPISDHRSTMENRYNLSKVLSARAISMAIQRALEKHYE